jgi:hypothetical protein
MSPALLFPAGLAALAAVLIPLVIHIARRTESRTIDFAALVWLEERPKPRRRLRLDELWLLAARLLLLTLIAVGLAQPVLWGAADRRPLVAVAPGLDSSSYETAEVARRVWLAPGFPEIGQAAPTTGGTTTSLVRQLDAELAPGTPLEVVVPPLLDDADAQRPVLSRPVSWRTATPVAETELSAPAPPALTVRFGPDGEAAVRYFRAAATAWVETGAEPGIVAEPLAVPLPRGARHLIWLDAGTPPAQIVDWVRRGGTIVLAEGARVPLDIAPRPVWNDAEGAPIAALGRLGQGRVIQLDRALTPETMPQLLEPDFPDRLAGLLAPAPDPMRVAATDHAPLTGAAPYEQPPLDLRPWLALLIALVFAGERWLATRRVRGAAP